MTLVSVIFAWLPGVCVSTVQMALVPCLFRIAAERRDNDGVKLSNIRGCSPLVLWDQRLTGL